jgi:YbgC/YbaW family acyl-CoA thioester hydrolase
MTNTLDIPARYSAEFRVLHHEVNLWHSLRSSSLLRYMEQLTVEAAAEKGFDRRWFKEHGTAWIMRDTVLQRFGDVDEGEELQASMWVSAHSRVRVTCEYEVRHLNGEPVAVGRAERIYFDGRSMRPVQLDPDLQAALPHGGTSPLWTEIPALPKPKVETATYSMRRHVNSYEADALGHTNNTNYVDWLEEAAVNALRHWGYPIAKRSLPDADAIPSLQHFSVQYLRPTYPDDSLIITSQLTHSDSSDSQMIIKQHIYRQADELCVEADSLYLIDF